MTDKTKAILGTVVSLLVAVLAVASEWQDMGGAFTTWSLRIVALLTVVSNVLGLKVAGLGKPDPGKVAGAGAILLGLLLIGIASSGCVSAGVKLTHGAMTLTNVTGQAFADAHKAYGAAVCPHIKRWKAGARPGMRLGVAGGVAAIKGKGDVLGSLRGGLCELARLFEAAKADLGKFGEAIAEGIKPYQGLVCPKQKSGVQLLAVILPVAQAVIRWLLDKLGAKDSVLLAEIDAWLRAGPGDQTDGLCTE